ncbi:MAG: hypothetical protein FWD94_07110 [Treponema sp.]|nr:hypothetical protein [Treponema sp.]
MELTDKDLEQIRTAARGIKYGNVKINIAADSDRLDLEINSRLRLEREPTVSGTAMPRKGGKGYRE